MVYSRIQQNIEYKEERRIHMEDMGHTSPIFQYTFEHLLPGKHQMIEITLGKMKYMKQEIVYYPIYLVTSQQQVKYQIGVYELLAKDSLTKNMEDLQHPLWFSFAKEIILMHYPFSSTVVKDKEYGKESKIGDDYDEHGNISVLDTNHHPKEIREEGIFTVELQRHEIYLPLETKTEADEMVRTFLHTKHRHITWVEQFFKNTYYKLHDVEDNGDSLFAVIRDAYQHIGYETTVANLRAIVAKHTTQEHYQYYKEKQILWTRYLQQVEHKSMTKKTTSHVGSHGNGHGNGNGNGGNGHGIQKKKLIQLLKTHIGSMLPIEALETMETFRQHIMKSTFYPDAFVIILLEQILKVKCIFLSEVAYQCKTPYDVLECHYDIVECQQEPFQPERYILISYDTCKQHYQLCSYKQKRIFFFQELPYHVKNMIQIRVSENNAGMFPYVKDFQSFQKSIGVRPLSTTLPTSLTISLPHPILFTFHGKSRCSAKPGKGSCEYIPISKCMDYMTLDRIPYWRQKLDDSWMDVEHPILIDGKSYASIHHYMEAAKYMKGLPTIAHQFSIESKSELSKHIHLLQQQCLPSAEDPPLVPDPGFSSRKQHEYQKALQAKFSKTEMKRILLETKDAYLQRYIPRQLPKPAHELMNLRRQLMK
jgi:hypothetical protein